MLRCATSKSGILVTRMAASSTLFNTSTTAQVIEAAECTANPVFFQPANSPTYVTANLFKTLNAHNNNTNIVDVPRIVPKMGVHTTAHTASTIGGAFGEADEDDMYNLPMRYIHWIMATGIISIIWLVQLARGTDDPKAKGNYMMLHKSIGFSLGFLTLTRLFYRTSSKIPTPLAGHALEHFAAYLSHQTLYFLMVFMPLTGILMGYYGGKGIPFFGLTIPGAPEAKRDGDIAKAAFKTHKLAGQIFYYLLPIHFGAAAYHQFVHAQHIFRRVNPLVVVKVAT
eukprot:TRINITY_DN35008_c0_g1_i1.p1 TRINITY_DN35008_c0_g1~~TRINITY_DN35008_c0_g1_i1.p1  ORF type:complete len:283 (-),score=49.60 TRINITY_DN35008_c0_g1_i1:334-1182(-)